MAKRVRFKFDEAQWRKMQGPGGSIDKAVERAAGVVRDRGRENLTADGRIGNGRLRQSINSERNRSMSGRQGVWYTVGSRLFYARWQHDGTKGPILPRRAKVLRFRPKGGGAYVFARQVRGVKPSRYMTRALSTLRAGDFSP